MNKIILISCVLSIVLSAGAPLYGFIGCQNDSKNCGTGGTCNGKIGTCTCAKDKQWGYSCVQSAKLTAPAAASVNDLSSCSTAITAIATEVATACKTSLGTAVAPGVWDVKADNAQVKFANLFINFAATRTVAFTFALVTAQNALDYAEYYWIYVAYNQPDSLPTAFQGKVDLAKDYIKAIYSIATAYTLANVYQTSAANGAKDFVNASANYQEIVTAASGLWKSAIYSTNSLTPAVTTNAYDKPVAISPVSNAIEAGYGQLWSKTVAQVGYMHVFQKWGNPGVVIQAGCKYTVYLAVIQVTTAESALTASNQTSPATFATPAKMQVLTFTDTLLDKNYKCMSKTIDFATDGDAKEKACEDGKCVCNGSTVAAGQSIIYVYTTVLSNYLISFSLILSALTLSL